MPITVPPQLLVEGPDVPKLAVAAIFQFLIDIGLNGVPEGEDLVAAIGSPLRVGPSGLLGVAGAAMMGGYVFGGYAVANGSAPVTAAALTINGTNRLDYIGRAWSFDRATDQALTIDASAGDGFCLMGFQDGDGQVVVAATGGLTLANEHSHTRSARPGAPFCVLVTGTKLRLYGSTT